MIENKVLLKNANELFRQKNYQEALNIYIEASNDKPELKNIIDFNIELCIKKLGLSKKSIYELKNHINLKKCSTYNECKKLAIAYRKKIEYNKAVIYWMECIKVIKENEIQDFFVDIKNNLEYFMQQNEFKLIYKLTKALINKWPNNKLFIQLQAISLIQLEKYKEAEVVWQFYWNKAIDSNDFVRQTNLKLQNSYFNDSIFQEYTLDHQKNYKIKQKVCVYTALFGDYDKLQTPVMVDDNIDYICFSNTNRDIPGWKTILVDSYENNPILSNRKYKILPHIYLTNYDYSMYIDANIYLTGNLNKLISNLILEDFVAWKHPERSDIYSELLAIMSNFRHEPKKMIGQYKYFKKAKVPKNSGMIEACFIWRSHKNSSVSKLMNSWWEFVKENGNRDQPGLTYLMWKNDIRPKVFSSKYGNTRKNDFFVKLEHQQSPLSQKNATK